MFGKEFKVLKDFSPIYEKVGDKYPECFYVHEKSGNIEYCIIDDNFGQPSPANTHDGEYAKKLRKRSSDILKRLVDDGYIELIK